MIHKIIKYLICIWTLLCISFAQTTISKETSSTTNKEFLDLIQNAGNSDNEKERYQLLKRAASIPNLDVSLKKQLEGILQIVDYWANDSYTPEDIRKNAAENGYLCDFLTAEWI